MKKKKKQKAKDIFITQKALSQITIPGTQSTIPDSQMELFVDTQVLKLSKGRRKKKKDIYITQLPVSQMSIQPSQNETEYELTQPVSIDLSFIDKTLSETSINDSIIKDLSNDSSVIICGVTNNDKNGKIKPGNIKETKNGKDTKDTIEKEEEISVDYEAKNDKSINDKKITNKDTDKRQVTPHSSKATKRTTLSVNAARKSNLVKNKENNQSRKRKKDPNKDIENKIKDQSNPSKKVNSALYLDKLSSFFLSSFIIMIFFFYQ